jgi:hypothetical protein
MGLVVCPMLDLVDAIPGIFADIDFAGRMNQFMDADWHKTGPQNNA